ncbi:putative transposase Ptta/En/Spm plant [Arabidopsis suecica]|uniref:Putative transposase Ptta/En/Spm plant n=1 Tax=Arabidopsis suecica TaxID=45249 RepID=A0A8T2BP42_ARASU|nr:putative transposase Ptta/En/Spm plant [Arabidopsis suecica]
MLIVRPDAAGVLRDKNGQAYNEDGQKIDEHGNLIPEIAEIVDRHHHDVAPHQGGDRAAAIADGRAIPLGDYNKPDWFYADRYSCSSYQAHPPPTSASRMEYMLEQILKSQERTNQRIDDLCDDFNGKFQALNARINREDVSIPPRWTESNITTACHAILMEGEDEFVEIKENDVDFVVAEDHSTRSLSVDRHHLGVDRHSSGIDEDSTFDGEESSMFDTNRSTPDSSVDRHSPSVDRHTTRVEAESSNKAVFWAVIAAARLPTVVTASLPLHPPPKQLRAHSKKDGTFVDRKAQEVHEAFKKNKATKLAAFKNDESSDATITKDREELFGVGNLGSNINEKRKYPGSSSSFKSLQTQLEEATRKIKKQAEREAEALRVAAEQQAEIKHLMIVKNTFLHILFSLNSSFWGDPTGIETGEPASSRFLK